MKQSRDVIENRRKKIYELLQLHGTVKVDTLAAELGASPLTIRRDLDYLGGLHVLERFYGGASLLRPDENSNIFSSGFNLHKHAIARKAAELIEDGDTIFINTSSTALLILGYITAKQVTVITNNGKAIFCERPEDTILCLTGGELRMPKEAMVGDFAINNLNKVTAAKCFLGCSGVDAVGGITTAVLQEVAINELMLSRVTGARVLLADHSKIGRTHSFVSGAIDKISCIITDTEANAAALAAIRQCSPAAQIVQVVPLDRIG